MTQENNPITEGVTERAMSLYKIYTPEGVDHPEGIRPILEALAAERKQAMREALELPEIETLHEFLVHDPACILSCWEAGEPMPDGGYRKKYAGTWYESKPNDKTPKCNCGLDEAFKNFQSLRERLK